MEKNLLDTHTFIWFLNGDKELSKVARELITKELVSNFVSIASIWEIAIKTSINKLELKTPLYQLAGKLEENGFEILPVTFADTLTVSTLPFHHRDPFDRIIISQAKVNGMTIISKDGEFGNYDVKLVW